VIHRLLALGNGSKDRAVAQLEPNPTPRLKALGGGEADSWNKRIGETLFGALPGSHFPNFLEAARASRDGVIGVKPTDPIEGMIAAQIVAAHEASMHLRRLAWLPEQSFEAATKFLELAEKAARTVGVLSERLDQHRSRGQQQITVKHVTVNADQALVADTITTGGAAQKDPVQAPTKCLTAGVQEPMETLTGASNPTRVGGKKQG
jgi:hypothetical protein